MQRVLAAGNDQLRQRMAENRAIARHEVDDRQRDGKKADQAERREIGFILGKFAELIVEQGWNPVPKAIYQPSQFDHRDNDRQRDRDPRNPRPVRQRRLSGAVGGTGGRADDEQKLPGERIEEPTVFIRIGLRLPAEVQGQQINRERENQRRQPPASLHYEHDRKDRQQHDIERQDVKQLGLILQQHHLDDGDVRFLEKAAQPQLLAVGFSLQLEHRVGDFGRIDHENKYVGDI